MRIVLLTILVLATPLSRAEVVDGMLYSPALGVTKAYRVYLPPEYRSNNKQYPVIYLLHGWGVTEKYWVDTLGLAQTADAMNLQAIIVMPDGDRSFYANSIAATNHDACLSESPPRVNKQEPRGEFCVRRANYEDYIIRDLVPHIDGQYRTIARRKARAISGESGGGFGAMQLAMRNKAVFRSVAAHSAFLSLLYDGPRPYRPGKVKDRTSVDANRLNPAAVETFGKDITRWRQHDPVSLVNTLKSGELDIYFDCGIQDEYGFYDEARYFHDRLNSRGIVHTFESVQGKHEDQLWRERIKHSLGFHESGFRKSGVLPR